MAQRLATTKERQEERSPGPTAGPLAQVIGWQGVTLSVPADWSLVGFGGDEKAGSFRLDSGDVDSRLKSLELRWASAKGGQTIKDLETRIAPLLKKAARSAKRSGGRGETETHPLEDKRHSDRDAALGFSWRDSDVAAQGRIWHCQTCGRVVVAQIYGTVDHRSRALANEMLAGIECHSNEIGWRTWGLYGLYTELPADFMLAGQQLMNVYLQLSFQLGQSADLLTVEQWNLANVQLKGMYLDEWFEHKCAGLASTSKLRKEESHVHSHPALLATGRRTSLVYWFTEGVKQLARLKRPAVHYSSLLWECPETNRAYLIQLFSRRPQSELVKEIAGRMVCHS